MEYGLHKRIVRRVLEHHAGVTREPAGPDDERRNSSPVDIRRFGVVLNLIDLWLRNVWLQQVRVSQLDPFSRRNGQYPRRAVDLEVYWREDKP